jgi:hypothetical protein
MNRAQRFTYRGLDVVGDELIGHYDLDGVTFTERVSVTDGDLTLPASRALAGLWYLLAGLSYYKAGAAQVVDLGDQPVGAHGRALLEAALLDGLGEFAYRNDLDLSDVVFEGGLALEPVAYAGLPERVLIPFGGGIDSVVTVAALAHLDRRLFVVSPASGRFTPLEECAALTGLPVARVERQIDLAGLRAKRTFFNGHVPVTAMVTLLACIQAVSQQCHGVAMSNEHSASVPNLHWRGRAVNHQWSKSLEAELLIAGAVAERIGDDFVVASFLRDRSEIWVGQQFATLTDFHAVFRSCNRAFRQNAADRAAQWCGECDKCLFINLVLAPFLSRTELRTIFASEPLANPALEAQLTTLVGLGREVKPFECVGDPDESASALVEVSRLAAWSDVAILADLAQRVHPERSFRELLQPQGASRVPAHWLR